MSQRRHKGIHQGQPVDLASQDQPMENRESGLWVPASEHQSGHLYTQGHEDEEEEEEEQAVAPNGEQRGREEERVVAA